jgi:hypothetical protein
MLRNHPSITSRVYKTGANRRYSVVSKNEGILELGCIIIIYHLVLKNENELFLSGATALLIYASSAASICVDHYGRMFIGERSCLSDTQSVALSRAVNIAPTEPA